MPWLAVWTEICREDLAATWLRSQSIEVFYPQRLIRLHRQGSPYERRPAFPRYLFANPLDVPWQELRRRGRGIADIVRVGTNPCIMPDKVLAELRAKAPDGLFPLPLILPGQQYLIVNGNPLAGLLALVERVGGPSCVAWVRGFKVKLPVADLDPEPLTVVAKGRITRPLIERRKTRTWEAIE